ncbi:MAG TPA: tetratricopeptide repeat protein [Roseiarcus sp.]|nr:tetratricopeptide repeat protein [Roseiarcus sp.]
MSLIVTERSGRLPGALVRGATTALIFGTLVVLGGCRGSDDVTGSIGAASSGLPTGDSDLRAYADTWAKRYEANPGEKVASMNYARALRALTRYSEAVAVMQTAAVKAPKDFDVLGAYGKALADAGQLQQAADVLSRSYAPETPNWSNMSAQGAVADQLGDHTQAQEFYRNALKIAPNEPTILSNLGLSYALTKQLPRAEATLRQAVAQPGGDRRVRDNLALVLSLEGKFAEAQQVSEADMSPAAAAANVAAIRQMIAQSNSWRQIEQTDVKRSSGKPKKEAPDQAPMPIGPSG